MATGLDTVEFRSERKITRLAGFQDLAKRHARRQMLSRRRYAREFLPPSRVGLYRPEFRVMHAFLSKSDVSEHTST